MRVEVKFGATVHVIEVPDDGATLGQLKDLIREATGVLPAMQKLLGKPGLSTKADDTTLASLGIKDKTKLMLIGSTAEEVVKANAPTTQAEKDQESEQEKLMRSLPFNFWSVTPYAGLLADPFVTGKGHSLEGGSVVVSLLSLDLILSRINPLGASASNPFASSAQLLSVLGAEAGEQVSHRFLKGLPAAHKTAIQKAHAVVRSCFRFTMESGEGKFPDNILGTVDRCVNALDALPTGEWLMLPSGWLGLRSYNVMFLLIRKAGRDAFDFYVVNKGGEGSEYHPQWQTAEKIRSCAILRFERVAKERMMDRTFWLLCFALWLGREDPGDRSEFVRAEVFYDVLIPWLVEKDPGNEKIKRYATEMLLQQQRSGGDGGDNEEASTTVDTTTTTSTTIPVSTPAQPFSPFIMEHGGSMACSRSSAIQSAVAAFGLLLEQYGGMGREDIRQVKFALKYEFFLRATEDLAAFAGRYLAGVDLASPAIVAQHPGLPQLHAATAHMRSIAGLDTTNTTTTANAMTIQQVLAEAQKRSIVVKTAQNILLQPSHFANKMVIMYTGTLAVPGVKKFATLFADTAAAIVKRVKASAPEGGSSSSSSAPVRFVSPAAAVSSSSKASSTAAATAVAAATSVPLPDVEFLMLSCDQTRETYDEHAAMFTFPRAAGNSLELFRALDINQSPEVFVFQADGTLLHRQGVRAVRADPDGEQFPNGAWRGTTPLTATDVKMLSVSAAQLSHHTKKRYDSGASGSGGSGGGTLNEEDVSHVVRLVHAVEAVVAALPQDDVHTITIVKDITIANVKDITITNVKDNHMEPTVNGATVALDRTLSEPLPLSAAGEFRNTDLLPTASVAQYYGKPYHSSVPSLEDLCDFTPARSFAELQAMLAKSEGIVRGLWTRAGHSGTASRVAVQMHIIEFVTWLFSTMVPVPLPPSVDTLDLPTEEADCVSDFYNTDAFGPVAQRDEEADMQKEIMSSTYYLMLSLANAWQAVENPSRSFDAERCLIAMTMLLVYDAVARQQRGARGGFMLATLLHTDGGYFPSTTLGRRTVPFASVAATLELTRPGMLPIRSAVLRYVEFQRTTLKHELFDIRQPDKLELRKGSTTAIFLRTYLDNCGYSLDESGSMLGQNASEMEKLMEWLCGARTPLAREHPHFCMYRDMVLLAKFLGTMEMRDAQLLHRRKELDPLASWRLSFEEDAPGRQMSAGWRTRPSPPKWECVMVRGRDMDIADIIVKGFGDREVMYGEGLTMQSPIDVSRLIEVDHPTEDDVLHAKTMPSFGGAMSPEEAEVMLSCLTTPYLRIPLVLDFLSSQDRNTYLFVPEVQEALRAVLFEPAAYVSPETLHTADPRSVPMRLNALQKAEIELRTLRGDHSRRDYEECLGTTYGLLLNEIAHAPTAMLNPLRRILESVTELGPSSVYSANASYVIYVVGLVCDVMTFCRFVIEKRLSRQLPLVEEYHNCLVAFCHAHVLPLMREWLGESEGNSDTPTQCVIYAYKSMIDRTIWKGLLAVPSFTLSEASASSEGTPTTTADKSAEAERYLVSLLQDCSFVRARHGFGMGMQRTQLAAQEGDALLTPEDKLLRFLQAQGLDTSNVSPQMLEQGRQLMMGGGRRRAVFVQIRSRMYNDTVRVPNLFHSDPTSTTDSRLLKLPPADVPENVLFAFLLQDNLTITRFLDAATPERRGAVFQRVVQAVLRDHGGGGGEDSQQSSLELTPTKRRGLGLGRTPAISARASAVNLDQIGTAAAPLVAEPWTIASAGVYRGPPSSGLLFHAQTCELFWRNDELKPVPDSMSHFGDFENILGKEILQCGLVSRHEHRHWVHIVGTPYDVIEWAAAPDLADQGVHSPIVLEGALPAEPVASCVFEGTVYDRAVMEEEDPWPVRGERWAVEIVRQVLQQAFRGGMKFFPLAPALPSNDDDDEDDEDDGDDDEEDGRVAAKASKKKSADTTTTAASPRFDITTYTVNVLRFIMNDAPQYDGEEDRATWKEIVCHRYPQPHLDLFNLVPHARKMHRSLVFTTNQRYCLHSMALLPGERSRESLTVSVFQAGELKRRVQRESTLEIHRFNELVNGREVYLPARLLQGLIPSALLEFFFFWQGEDDVIRGYPLSDESGDASVLANSNSQKKGKESGKSARHHHGNDDTDELADAAAVKQKDRKQKQSTEMLDHWFNYAVEVHFVGGRDDADNSKKKKRCGAAVTVTRRDDKTYTLIHPRKVKTAARKGTATSVTTTSGGKGMLTRREPAHNEKEEGEENHSGWELAAAAAALKDSEVSLLRAALPHLPRSACAAILVTAGCTGDIAGAIEWAMAPANQATITALVRQSASSSTTRSSGGSNGAQDGRKNATRAGDRVLVNLLRCRALSSLLAMFTGLEDPSHMMVWGRLVAANSSNNSNEEGDRALSVEDAEGRRIIIESIELPRLRARFYTSSDGTSRRLRLFLADQPGWRVAEGNDLADAAHFASLRSLRDPFQQCLVLCNSTHEVALMVPNHDFTPMEIEGDPFSSLLLFDRSSYTWRESVPSPYYLYTVHTSNAFLLPATLSASLYYAVMQCATQHYSGALRTLESCYTDSPFSPEEGYMFQLFERTVADAYPDAHAVRLKLAHAVQYSNNAYQWSLPVELLGYLQKLHHVSGDCRLKRGEVLDLLKRCAKAVPLVRSQLELYAGLLSTTGTVARRTRADGSAEADVVVKTPGMDRCGFPWERLLLFPWEKISPQKLKRVTYSAAEPGKLVDGKLVDFIFRDELLGDEESGSNRKRGFYFLYSIKKGDVKPVLFGENVSVSFSQLMSRWFHLRHARWGREAQQSGETEMAPSWCGAVLQLMELFPSAEWPAPVATNERFAMARGFNLVPGGGGEEAMNWDQTRAERRNTHIPDVFNKMNAVARELFNVSSVAASIKAARSVSQSRTPETRSRQVAMFDHLVPRVVSQNTAMGRVEISESILSPAYFTGGGGDNGTDAAVQQQRRRTLAALCSEPLSELGFTTSGLISVFEPTTGSTTTMADEDADEQAEMAVRDGIAKDKRAKLTHTASPTGSCTVGGASSSSPSSPLLPFDIRAHPLARAPLAQNMLDRLEEDSARFAQQQRGATRLAFTALDKERMLAILTSNSGRNNRNCGGEAYASIKAAGAALAECEVKLFALARADASTVAKLTASIMARANDINMSNRGSSTAPVDTKSPAYLAHCLELARRGRVPVSMEWVCGGLLSTELEAELSAVNPFHGSVPVIRAEVVLLMLLSNRGFFAEQSALAVRNVSLFLEFCELIRNLHATEAAKDGAAIRNDNNSDGDDAAAYVQRRQQRILELVQHFSLEIEPRVLAELMAGQAGRGDRTAVNREAVRLPEEVAKMLLGRGQQLVGAALDLITAKRFYATAPTTTDSSSGGGGEFVFSLDPRFLLFEFMFNILLRARQVEMVRWFVENIRGGQSRVQQMIMGQGKTTVVGPLLALILADGTQLVTQVMPTALLEQTCGILRRCFSVVVVKHIYTLQFDRSFDDGGSSGDSGDSVEILYQKLKSAEEDRSVVIAAPECIKSLFLKEIEQLHMINSVATADLNNGISDDSHTTPGGSTSDERNATHATALRKKTIARSTMADAITPILQLWKRGVLIMDEVDVLLHPLRSELNFPIGLKHPIDMTGHRWLLPIHLLDAIFFFQRGCACEDVQTLLRLATSSLAATASNTKYSTTGGVDPFEEEEAALKASTRAAALGSVRAAIAKGFADRSLQREPHLVLLDTGYYEAELLPALVPWLQLWLHVQVMERLSRAEKATFALAPFSTFCARTTPFLLSAVREDESVSPTAAYINANTSGFGVQLLNLAHDWLHRLLPHVLAKIDRVSFGVLQASDLALTAGASSSAEIERIPYSRRMMAVPFVAKDVPSRSSEFAHPDVVIGLTVLAFRYEGLRGKDVKELVTQLKQDFARQAGPKEHRPAAKLYRRWLQLSSAERNNSGGGGGSKHINSNNADSDDAVASFERAGVPLSQLQVTDKAQLLSLHRLLHCVPEVIHYYLCSCIFPRTMNFQPLKISACGHELGSSMLFTKRIGFSGTPSNLLPLDLGECCYEPGSDGRVLAVLTDPEVTHAEVLPDSWTPLRVLDRIAAAQPPMAALIDSGALITNMENEDVARYLLRRLTSALFDGVVFLDNRDRQMILQRDNGLIVPVAQCGVSLSRRFTFFDQVHTTGTDVRQSASATAVITLGKDLVFRDYAQGAYRMRGIGKGQRLCLYLIPEVTSRISEVLGPFKTGDMLRDVPAWLLLNSMKVEGLQFFKLSLQELANVWRKKAIGNLMRDSAYANAHADIVNGYIRCRRFHSDRPISLAAAVAAATEDNTNANEERERGDTAAAASAVVLTEFDNVSDPTTLPDISLLRCSIQEFRETIEYPVAARVEAPKPFLTHLQELVEERPQELIEGDAPSQALVEQLLTRMRRSIQASHDAAAASAATANNTNTNAGEQAHQTMDLNAEIVHEQEAEEEQEQEAEQEEQRISAFSRDDEFQVPWGIDTLRGCGADPGRTVRPTDGCCFFQLNSFQIRESQPHLRVDPSVLLSDNYFRLDWHGVGERRLKNAFLFVEWIPLDAAGDTNTLDSNNISASADGSGDICSGLITLAEGESLRWLVHHSKHAKENVAAALRFVSTGRYMDATGPFSARVHRSGVAALQRMRRQQPHGPSSSGGGGGDTASNQHFPVLGYSLLPPTSTSTAAMPPLILSADDIATSPDKAALLFRFFNNDMFFSDRQLQLLEHVLRAVSTEDRLQFFVECLRVRRRHRNHWEDAPIAALFVAPDDRANLRQLAVAKKLQLSLEEMLAVVLRAVARPRCGASLRREAGAIMESIQAFSDAVARATSGSGGVVSIPANHIALMLLEAFPMAFAAFSTYDVAQGIAYAVTKSRQAAVRARGGSGKEEEVAGGGGGGECELKDSAAIGLGDLFAAFPALDMHLVVQRSSAAAATNTLSSSSAPGSPPPAAAGGTVAAQEPWHCEACTYRNEPTSRVCAMCMSSRPKSSTTAAAAASSSPPPALSTGDNVHDEDEEGTDCPWQCPVCTFINDTRATPVCTVCLANNPNPLVDRAKATSGGAGGGAYDPMMGDVSWDCPEGYWVCSVEHGGCSKFNPNNVFYCQVCEKARPNLASVRF